jgi:hypothetical protein
VTAQAEERSATRTHDRSGTLAAEDHPQLVLDPSARPSGRRPSSRSTALCGEVPDVDAVIEQALKQRLDLPAPARPGNV